MKRTIALLLAIWAAAAAAQDPGTIGSVRMDGREIEVYNSQGWCKNGEGNSAASFSVGDRSKFVIGCWRPLFTDQVLVNFQDGSQVIFYKTQLVRAATEQRKFSL